MDPQQELFTALKLAIDALGYSVFDGFLPPEGTPYPFVYLGETLLIDSANKTAVFGVVHQTVHIWHDTPRKRGTVSDMALNIKRVARRLTHTQNFAWYVSGIDQQMLHDTTTRQPLLHAVVDFEFKFS